MSTALRVPLQANVWWNRVIPDITLQIPAKLAAPRTRIVYVLLRHRIPPRTVPPV